MTATILVAGPALADRVRGWGEDYAIVMPDDLAADGLAGRGDAIRVVVTGGEDFPAEVVDRLPNVGLVACFSTGYAGIDLAALRARGIALTSAGGVNAHDVADHALALTLARWHGIVAADAALRDGRWRGDLVPRRSLRGRSAGVVGLGRIGIAVADRLAALGMTVRWWGPRDKPGAPYPRTADLLGLASESDILVVTSRAVPSAAHQIDADVIAALGPSGLLVNVSRGMLVDEDALIAALRDRRLGGAALDVFAGEPTPPGRWAGVPGVVLTPHIAGFTVEAGTDMEAQLRENVRRFLAGEPLLSPVNDPG